MMVEVKVPEIGESITEGVILEWYKKTGEIVAVDDALFELETDKITDTVTSLEAGRIEILVSADETVQVGQVIAKIDTSVSANAVVETKTSNPEVSSAPTKETIASPAARHVALQHDVNTNKVVGSGKDGRVLKEDVHNHLQKQNNVESAAPKATPVPPAKQESKPSVETRDPDVRETRQPMSQLRKRIAQRLLEAQQNAAILTTFNEVDLTNLMKYRKAFQDDFVAKHGVKLGFMSFFVKGAVEALKEVPEINAYIDGDDIVYNHFFDIGIAVGTEKGLVVPIVRNAEQLSFAGIELEIANLAKKARDRKLKLEDMAGGSFTISNGGVYGSLLSTPILNPPQSAILGMHGIKSRPVAVGDKIEIRPMMYLALSYDHRIVDGKGAVTCLKRIVECVENPERMLFGI